MARPKGDPAAVRGTTIREQKNRLTAISTWQPPKRSSRGLLAPLDEWVRDEWEELDPADRPPEPPSWLTTLEPDDWEYLSWELDNQLLDAVDAIEDNRPVAIRYRLHGN